MTNIHERHAGVNVEYLRRRTFAIISHPDAGKTTLTEKLLLFGGAIRLAGQVKARGDRRRAHSDWLKIEQQRGISVTSSAMTFEWGDCVFNLLDTPGHEDFSEDTYRTLTAVDSAIMVLDAAKGIESQTLKLLEVCRLRDIPILTFINKIDRESRDPLALMDEVASTLALDVSPMTWPIGTGGLFQGCLDLRTLELQRPDGTATGALGESIRIKDLRGCRLNEFLDDQTAERLRGEVDLITGGYAPWSPSAFKAGTTTPVYFGSALKNFAVEPLLRGLKEFAPAPQPQTADTREVRPGEDAVTGFIFKVQANMDRNHRDRMAFMRVCSGRFVRGMRLEQVRTGRGISVHSPTFFLAQERERAEEAWAGDILGIPNHGVLQVGDTLTEGEALRFRGLPAFAPEIIRRVRLDEPLKMKQLRKALNELADEGVMRLFTTEIGSQILIGVVGQLQLDVLLSRIQTEYDIQAGVEAPPQQVARWVSGPRADLDLFLAQNRASLARDRQGDAVYLARSQWDLDYAEQNWPQLAFSRTREIG
ncbi:MAG: peptide chain release factor 3 [Brevundimonas sp.]|uniref:peptide chain release factor 3 n=1 Tax=Brevundimonas sp. TaxID=1871086 RepID=UPI00391B9DBA